MLQDIYITLVVSDVYDENCLDRDLRPPSLAKKIVGNQLFKSDHVVMMKITPE